MALEWLKPILGDGYTEEIDKAVSEQIGKGFVARADFNELKESLSLIHIYRYAKWCCKLKSSVV